MCYGHCSILSLWLSSTLHTLLYSLLCFWYYQYQSHSQPLDSSYQTFTPLAPNPTKKSGQNKHSLLSAIMCYGHCSILSLWLSSTLHTLLYSLLCFWYYQSHSQPLDSSYQTFHCWFLCLFCLQCLYMEQPSCFSLTLSERNRKVVVTDWFLSPVPFLSSAPLHQYIEWPSPFPPTDWFPCLFCLQPL